MELYLIKSTACLGIFYIFYKFFLENESIHVFKRVYLLAALVLSYSIPFITFYVPTTTNTANPVTLPDDINGIETSTFNLFLEQLPLILGILYFVGVLVFAYRFTKNLYQIISKIRRNPKLKIAKYIQVLLQDKVLPHTFFNYIFLNKTELESKEIPSEVIIHEQTHAQQKHSIDILFIEFLQVLFWFNPFIYFLKRSIKLNHEFLADQAVLNQGIAPNYYQNLLLVFSSNTQTPILANSINYSLIKKRFTVMKTQSSKNSIRLRVLLLLPLLALLIYSFSTTEEINKDESNPIEEIEIIQKIATKAQVKEYNKLAKKYNDMDEGRMKINKADVQRLKYLYNLMSDKQQKNAEPFPNFPPPPPPIKGTPRTSVKVIKGVNDTDKNVPPPPPKAPEPVMVKKGVNDKDPNVPPPPPKTPKKIKLKESKNDKEKVKQQKEKLVLQRVKLEDTKRERLTERKVFLEKRNEDRDKVRVIREQEPSDQRIALRTTQKEREKKVKIMKQERQNKIEARKKELKSKNKEKVKEKQKS